MYKFPKRIRISEQDAKSGLPLSNDFWVGREGQLENGLTLFRAAAVWVRPGGQLWMGRETSEDNIFYFMSQRGESPPWEDDVPAGMQISIIDLNTNNVEVWCLPSNVDHPASLDTVGRIFEVRSHEHKS